MQRQHSIYRGQKQANTARWALLRPFVAQASVPTDNPPLPLHDEADRGAVLGREQAINFSLPGAAYYYFAVDTILASCASLPL